MQTFTKAEMANIVVEATEAGNAAVKKCIPDPMVVCQNGKPIDIVMDGVCGFAWVSIRPGNCRFAKYMKEIGLGRADSYEGGVTYWIGEFNQSMSKKETFAHAFAEVLNKYGINANVRSRMD